MAGTEQVISVDLTRVSSRWEEGPLNQHLAFECTDSKYAWECTWKYIPARKVWGTEDRAVTEDMRAVLTRESLLVEMLVVRPSGKPFQ